MPGGLKNPLGARALYLFQDGQDTLYRLHGSPEWCSIGKSVSSGCVRLINQDVIDLYDRVPNETPVIVTAGVGGAYSGVDIARSALPPLDERHDRLSCRFSASASGCPGCRAPARGRPRSRPSGPPI